MCQTQKTSESIFFSLYNTVCTRKLVLDQYLLRNVFTIAFMSYFPSVYKSHSKTATEVVTERFVLMESFKLNLLQQCGI